MMREVELRFKNVEREEGLNNLKVAALNVATMRREVPPTFNTVHARVSRPMFMSNTRRVCVNRGPYACITIYES